jgi:predicted RNA-binding protein associated with RNAse of E/G family
MDPAVTVHKLDHAGREVWRYAGRLVQRGATSLTLHARFDREDVTFQAIRLLRGDRFVETFYTDRWYNVFTIYDRHDGRLKGWYCNITRPARFENDGIDIFAEDLALDLIVYPDGRWLVLDEEEYAALPLSLDERRQALAAVTDLQRMVIRQEGPFAAIRQDPA